MLAEMKIAAGGRSVELQYILTHAEGYKKFHTFLEKELATENLLFWHAGLFVCMHD
jgi:hypothetical protein